MGFLVTALIIIAVVAVAFRIPVLRKLMTGAA